MAKMSLKNLVMLVLSILLVIGIVLTGGCLGKETGTPTEPPAQEIPPPINEPEPPSQEAPPQIIESIPPLDAFSLIQENQDNSDFVIIDVRTPEEFTEEHIENAINLDYHSETFRDELDKNKTYLIYCRSGSRSGSALDTMEELNFKEVYNLLGGINQWKAEGLSTIQETPIQVIESIPPLDAFSLIQENQDNSDFVIIDVRTPEEFTEEHIENAINLDYHSETFRDELDKNKTYLIYCRSGSRSGSALDTMEELNFKEVYNLLGGINQWKAERLSTIQETPIQIIESIPPLDVFSLIRDNQDNPNFVIIDIQTPEDFAKGHIENAININYHSETFRDELDTLDRNKTYLIYYECACGGRDTNTLEMMEELDFQEVYKISGGLRKWKSEGLPTVK